MKRNFGSKMRKHRNNLGLTQEKLADLAGLSRTHIGNIERGEKSVSLINAQKIAKALQVDVKDLIPET